MTNRTRRHLLAVALLALSPLSTAGVFMCTDPASGKKYFTDRACPAATERKQVKVEPTNFGQGVKTVHKGGTWASDRDARQAVRANTGGHSRANSLSVNSK